MSKKIVVVTGAAGVLSGAVARTLHQANFEVVGLDRTRITDDGTFALALSDVDLTDEASVAAAFDKIGTRFGTLDGLVNVAGGFRWETIADGAPSSWDFLYRINVVTALLTSRAALPMLIASKGAIVNVSAAASRQAGVGMGAYAASKSGVSRLTEALAEEMKASEVRVNAVLPSIIDTPANRADMPDADFAKWVTAADLAAVIAFLLSPASIAITGALIPVTGLV